jgi:hypothetical protein
MARWLLLLLTIGCGLMAYDAWRWRFSIKKSPFTTIANLWKGGTSHLSVSEQNKIRDGFASGLAGRIVWLFMGGTVVFAALTVRAFLE